MPKSEEKKSTRVGARMGRDKTSTERIAELEFKLKAANAKVSSLEQKLEEFMKITEGKISLLSQENITLAENCKIGIEKERHKRLDIFKKIHKLNTDEFEKLNTKLDSDRLDHASIAREVSLIRDLVDELFYKRFGIQQNSSPSKLFSSNGNSNSSPSRERHNIDGHNENMASYYVSGFEKVNILDQLCMRVAGLEMEVLGTNSNQSQSMNTSMQQTIYGLSNNDFSSKNSRSNRVLSLSDEMKSLKKKVKELNETTVKAYTALSGGLSDIQATNLGILSWADKAHIAIGICADKLGFHGNPCPQIPSNLYISNTSGLASSASSSSSPALGASLLTRSHGHSPSDRRLRNSGLDF